LLRRSAEPADVEPVSNELFDVLAARSPRGPRGLPSRAAVLRILALAAVPVAVAALAALLHDSYRDLIWPPSPVIALAPLASCVVITRGPASRAEVIFTAALSSLNALVVSWGIALVLGMFAALECLGPNGGCLPW
jgi:hypothetical protein